MGHGEEGSARVRGTGELLPPAPPESPVPTSSNPSQSSAPSGLPPKKWEVFLLQSDCSTSSSQSQEQGHGQPPSSGSLEEEERELELLLEEELELEELDELDEEELEDGALLEESGSWGTKELLWKLEDDQLLEELDEEELELLEDDELEEEGGALLEESGGSGAEELGWKLDEDEELLEEELLDEEELELLLDLGSNSNESPPPAELLDESPSSSSWYRLTSVSTVSPCLPGGIVSFER